MPATPSPFADDLLFILEAKERWFPSILCMGLVSWTRFFAEHLLPQQCRSSRVISWQSTKLPRKFLLVSTSFLALINSMVFRWHKHSSPTSASHDFGKKILRKRSSLFGQYYKEASHSLHVGAAMITTCTQACKFIDYGVRCFLKSIVAFPAGDEGYVQKSLNWWSFFSG